MSTRLGNYNRTRLFHYSLNLSQVQYYSFFRHHGAQGKYFLEPELACNGPNPPLADIVLWTFSFELPLKVFKTYLLGGIFHTLIKNVSFSSSTDEGSQIAF